MQLVIEFLAILAGAVGETHQFRRRDPPSRGRKHAGGGNIIVGLGDQPEVGDEIFDERMLQDGEPGDDKWDFAL